MVQDPTTLKTPGGRFLLMAVQQIVDAPAVVQVREIIGQQSVVLEVGVDRPDYKRVVGRGGRTASALRELLLNIGGKESRRYVLEIIEPTHRLEEIPTAGWQDPVLPAPEPDED